MRLDTLTLACTALWTLLRDRTDLTEEDLLNRIRELDLADGQADGKIGKKLRRCPKCDRVMSPRHRRCLYCGAENLEYEAFDGAV